MPARNGPPASHSVSPPFFGMCISELQKSRADMSSRMEVISGRLDAMDCRLTEERASSTSAADAAAVQLCLSFARPLTIAVLHSGRPQVQQIPTSLCAGNSVVPVLLRSPPSCCTLREFCFLISHVRQKLRNPLPRFSVSILRKPPNHFAFDKNGDSV